MNRKSMIGAVANTLVLGAIMRPLRAFAVTRVHLVNKQWNSVVVEVRRGDSTDPEQNSLVPGSPFTIPKGGEQVISSDGLDVFYRRPNDPNNPASGWTSWYHRSVFPDHDEDLTEEL